MLAILWLKYKALILVFICMSLTISEFNFYMIISYFISSFMYFLFRVMYIKVCKCATDIFLSVVLFFTSSHEMGLLFAYFKKKSETRFLFVKCKFLNLNLSDIPNTPITQLYYFIIPGYLMCSDHFLKME